MITKEIENALETSEKLDDFFCRIYSLVEDTLIRKGNLKKIINIINQVAL